MKLKILLLLICSMSGFAQRYAAFEADQTARKKPLSFSHQPFLLLKVTPTAFLGRDNVFQYGAELAPPFGKFSFAGDFGKGKGEGSLNKKQKNNYPEQTTQIIRAEIRGYFSDWYPFYALDKKPFGRYYSLEYVQKNITRDRENSFVDVQGINDTALKLNTKEQALHVKIGKHFLISKWFFIDASAGVGLGRYSNISEGNADPVASLGFSFKPNQRLADTKGLFLSKTAAIRFCLPI